MSSVGPWRRNSPAQATSRTRPQRGPFGVDGGEPRRVAVAPLHDGRLPENALVGQAQPLRRAPGRPRSARRTSTRSVDTRPRRPISSSGTSPRSPRRCAEAGARRRKTRPRWTRLWRDPEVAAEPRRVLPRRRKGEEQRVIGVLRLPRSMPASSASVSKGRAACNPTSRPRPSNAAEERSAHRLGAAGRP
jgi:hypothetical protein